MAVLSRAALKAAIDLVITTNGTGAITGAVLNGILNDIADSVANLTTDEGKIGAGSYDPAETYDTGIIVVYQGSIYQAAKDGITGAFNADNWTKLASIDGFDLFDFVAYDNGATYNIGDRVYFEGLYFTCDVNGTTGIPPVDTAPEWTERYVNDGNLGNPYQNGFYLENHVVEFGDKLYKLEEATLPSFESTDFNAELTAGNWIAFGDHGSLTGAQIKTLYEGEADTNAFTDTEQSKLSGIESGATADQTGAEIKTALFAEADTNNFDDAAKNKLDAISTYAEDVQGITTTSGGAWVQRTIAASSNKTIDVLITTSALNSVVGVREAGSALMRNFNVEREGAVVLRVLLDGSGNFEIYSDAVGVTFDKIGE